MTRLFYITVGCACVGLGAVGVVLPLLPTTPFLLLAALCFARSSPALSAWLTRHPIFGPLIGEWKTHRAIAPRTKIVALCAMGAALGISVLAGAPAMVLVIQCAVLAGAGLFIVSRPNPPQDGRPESSKALIGSRYMEKSS